LAEFVVGYSLTNGERFSMDKSTRLGDWFLLIFMPKYTKYHGSFVIWYDPATRTQAAAVQLNDDEKEFLPAFRELCNLLRALPTVTNADLDSMGLPKKSSHEHHPAPIADKAPAFDVIPLESHRLRITFYPEGSETRRGKPHGQHGAEIKWAFTDAPKVEPDDLVISLFDTDSPYTLDFHVADAGKRVGIALRWENSRGLKGPWSDVAFAFVP
jgi:hypothetical protein